jgi:glucose dehydrogenase
MRTLFVVIVSVAVAFPQTVPRNEEWPSYGGDPGASRYSPLDQINTTNVARLRRAWTYHTGERGRNFETTPIMVGGVVYLSAQNQKIVALDPESGREIWQFDPKSNGREHRGVSWGPPAWPARQSPRRDRWRPAS